MGISEILNILLGGGMLGLIIGISTLKATVRKAKAEAAQAKALAKKAEAEAEAVRITNAENATRILVENIVKPLKDELYATREELASNKRATLRLARAIEAAKKCRMSGSCPVLGRLRNSQKDTDGADTVRGNGRNTRDKGHRNKADPQGDDPEESGESDDPG